MTARLQSVLTAGLVALAAGLPLVLSRASTVAEKAPSPAAAPAAFMQGFAGSASCSSRACHGGDKPLDAETQQNEYTISVLYDKHTRAYAELLGEKGRRIAENLKATNPDGKVVPAHLDRRCLACHATPESALASEDGKEPDSVAVTNWRLAGVGCESCHGPASREPKPWLALHTDENKWRKAFEKTPDDPAWKEYGFTNLSDLPTQAAVCAGCHVGAPAVVKDGKTVVPARDCNHDVMAAGHPRLNFEFASYRNNMPPHWNVKKQKQDTAEYDTRAWAAGQVVAARHALDLLAQRAREADKLQTHENAAVRWPEFAEYRCYACHADLNTDWRTAANSPDRPKGSLPYDNWYHALVPLLAKDTEEDYAELTALMARPLRDPSGVAAKAEALSKKLAGTKIEKPDPKKLATALAGRYKETPRTWEEATQVALCVAALKRDRAAEKSFPLQKLAEELAFPTARDGKYKGQPHWGPRGLDGSPADRPAARKAFGELMKALP